MSLLSRLFRREMSCADVLEVLQSYLDGETGTDVAREVAIHLSQCDHCDRESQVYAEIRASLHRRRGQVDREILVALSDFGHRLPYEGDGVEDGGSVF